MPKVSSKVIIYFENALKINSPSVSGRAAINNTKQNILFLLQRVLSFYRNTQT